MNFGASLGRARCRQATRQAGDGRDNGRGARHEGRGGVAAWWPSCRTSCASSRRASSCLRGPRAWRALLWPQKAPGQHHQGRQQRGAAHAGRNRLALLGDGQRGALSCPSYEAIPILSAHVTLRFLAASSRLVLKPTGLKRDDILGLSTVRELRCQDCAIGADVVPKRPLPESGSWNR